LLYKAADFLSTQKVEQTRFDPMHPVEILLEEFLKPKNITQCRLAKDINFPHRRISEIIKGRRAIKTDTALRLGRFFRNESSVLAQFAGAL
jgi:addiction module HigA family antidote